MPPRSVVILSRVAGEGDHATRRRSLRELWRACVQPAEALLREGGSMVEGGSLSFYPAVFPSSTEHDTGDINMPSTM